MSSRIKPICADQPYRTMSLMTSRKAANHLLQPLPGSVRNFNGQETNQPCAQGARRAHRRHTHRAGHRARRSQVAWLAAVARDHAVAAIAKMIPATHVTTPHQASSYAQPEVGRASARRSPQSEAVTAVEVARSWVATRRTARGFPSRVRGSDRLFDPRVNRIHAGGTLKARAGTAALPRYSPPPPIQSAVEFGG